MGYELKQYFSPRKTETITRENASSFLTLKYDISNPVPDVGESDLTPTEYKQKDSIGYISYSLTRRRNIDDYNVLPEGIELPFYDECVYFTSGLKSDRTYYFHAKVKRTENTQTFYIKLVKNSTGMNEEQLNAIKGEEQYLRTINVAGGGNVYLTERKIEWVDVEFIFTPMQDFDGIVFELQRTSADYLTHQRYALIAFLECGEILNVLTETLGGIKPIKLGVQSRPGLLMCINGEEIRTSRTGIYELKNGVIVTDFFSVASASDESLENFKNWQEWIKNNYYQHYCRVENNEIVYVNEENQIHSMSFLGTSKTKITDSFTLDYMYQQD